MSGEEKSDLDKYNDALQAISDKKFDLAERLLNIYSNLKDKKLKRKVLLLTFDEKKVTKIHITEVLSLKSESDKGNSYAQDSVGKLTFYGYHGVKKDHKIAVHFYRLSANQGNPRGQFDLSFMFHFGYGVHKSYQEAIRLYRLSVDQGNSYAQLNLGYMYFEGLGVEQNYDEAMKLFCLSAEQGNSAGICNKGYIYERGLGGVEKNYIKAVQLYQQSAKMDDRVGITPVNIKNGTSVITFKYYNVYSLKRVIVFL